MKIFPYLEIIRPLNVFIAVLVAVISVFLSGSNFLRAEVPLILLTVLFITSGANSLNDYFDREIDKLAHPLRPIARGAISPRSGLIFSMTLILLGSLFSFPLKKEALFLVILSVFLIILYNAKLKKLPLIGNFVVSTVAGSLFLYVGLGLERWKSLLFPALFAFLFHFGREIVKDIEDIEGDRTHRLRTYPIIYGEKRSKRLIQAIFLLLIAITPIPYFLHLYNFSYFILVIIGVDIPLFLIILYLERKSVNMGKISTLLKIDIFIALLALYMGGKP